MARDRSSSRGITLIEALVVLAVLAIAMGVAIPNLRAYSVRSKLLTPVKDAERVLSVARLQALNAQRPAVVAFMKNDAVWSEWPAESFTNKDSVIAFLDNDGSGTFTSGDAVVEAFVLPPTMDYKRPGGAEPVPTARVIYNPGGALATGANAEVYFGDGLGNYIRIVLVGATGHVRRQMYDEVTSGWISQTEEAKWPWKY